MRAIEQHDQGDQDNSAAEDWNGDADRADKETSNK